MGIKENTKRINLAEGETIAINVNELSALNDAPKRVIKSILKRVETLKKKYLIDILEDKEREKGKVRKELSCKTKDGVIEKKEDVQEEVKAKQPKLYDHKPSKKKTWKGNKPTGKPPPT